MRTDKKTKNNTIISGIITPNTIEQLLRTPNMSYKIYLDTNVIMDFFLNRDSSAHRLIVKSLKCKYYIIISQVVMEELKYQKLADEANSFVNILCANNKILVAKVKDTHKREAKELIRTNKTHYNDALHKILASEARVHFFVTKNIKDFQCFKDINIRKPDEL